MCKKYLSFLLKNDIATLLLRIFILYVILFLTQVIFYFYNQSVLGNISIGEFFKLMKGAIVFNTISIIYLNGLFIILSILPLRIRSHQIYQNFLFWLFVITNSVGIILLNIGDAVYFHYALKRFTSEEFHFLQNTNNTSVIWNVIKTDFWLLLIVVVLIILMIWGYKKIKYQATEIKNKYVYYAINTIVFLGIVYLCIGGIRGGFAHNIRPYTLSNAVYYTESPQKANLILSNPFCVLRTMSIQKLDHPHYFEEKILDSIYSPNHYPTHSTINLGNRNIVIFILESFSKEHSKFYCPEIYPNENGYTPFLDSLMSNGYVFQNAFSNGRKSIEAMPSILTSIPSYKRSFVLLPQSLGKVEGLPKMLIEKGYNTSFFCGAEKNSMGFESFALLSGIQKLYSKEDYIQEGYAVNKNTIEPLWGLFDMPFYLYMADKLESFKQPFFVSVFNLTSHHPFVVPSDYQNKVPKGHTVEQPCVAYTDMAIKAFFEKVKNTDWFKNTIFVFVADHVSSEVYAEQTKTPKGNTAIFMFMYTPDHRLLGKDEHTTQQADIMPTLLGIIGNERPYFSIGRDVFNEKERMPIATNFINQYFQCITDSITLYFDGEKVQSAFYNQDTLQKHNMINQTSKYQQSAENQLKAVLQVYYDRLNKKDYTTPK